MNVKTCGQCVFWDQQENQGIIVGQPKFGICRGAPPSVFPSPQGMVCACPTLPENFIACGTFKPREAEIKPAEA